MNINWQLCLLLGLITFRDEVVIEVDGVASRSDLLPRAKSEDGSVVGEKKRLVIFRTCEGIANHVEAGPNSVQDEFSIFNFQILQLLFVLEHRVPENAFNCFARDLGRRVTR